MNVTKVNKSVLSPEKKENQQTARTQSEMSIFDTFSYGFDLPAGVQLNRLNKKLYFWETTQNHIEERKLQRETWAKNILKQQSQKDSKMLKAFAEKDKLIKT